MNENSAVIKEIPQNFLAPSTTWGQSEKMPAMNQEEVPYQNATMLVT